MTPVTWLFVALLVVGASSAASAQTQPKAYVPPPALGPGGPGAPASGAGGAGTTGDDPDSDYAEEDDLAKSQDGAAAAAVANSSATRKPPEVGPKIMGYDHFLRLSYSTISGDYSDDQANEARGRTSGMKDVKVRGRRFQIERYPLLYEGEKVNQYLYTLLEYRDERPKTTYWTSRQTAKILMGYVLPFRRLVAPVVGLHMEFNKISLGEDDSPEVAKSDIRAHVIGVDFRQKIWGTGQWFGVFYEGKVHLLNFTLPNNGYELEAGIGTAQRYGFFRVDASLGYLYQVYRAKRESGFGSREKISVDSKYKALLMTGTLWI